MKRLVVACATLLLALPRSAYSAASDASAAAELLFREAKALMAAKDYTAACPKLAESMRLDPGTGTLLTLALCHESLGATASAWAEFNDAVAPSREGGRADRVQIATTHAEALERRLVRIRLAVDPAVAAREGLSVTRDGAPVSPSVFGAPIPIDPGEHTIRVTLGDRQLLSQVVSARNEGETYTVEISDAAFRAAAEEADATDVASQKTERKDHPYRRLGFVVGGVGAAGLAVGTISGITAIVQAHDAKGMCPGDVCPTPSGINLNNRAKTSAAVADVAFAAGAVLAAGGVVLVLLPGAKETPAVEARIEASPGGMTFGLSGAF